MGTPLRAVLFDLWGTLIVDDPAAGDLRHRLRVQRAQDTLAALGFDFSIADIETGFAAAAVQHSLLHDEERDLSIWMDSAEIGRELLATRAVPTLVEL